MSENDDVIKDAKKMSYQDMMSTALLYMSNLGEPDKLFAAVLEGGQTGLESLTKICNDSFTNVKEDEMLYSFFKVAAYANSVNMILFKNMLTVVKDPVLKSFMFFAATNLTAALHEKMGTLTHEDICDLSGLTALLSPQTVDGLLGRCRDEKASPDEAEADLMNQTLPPKFMEDLQRHFDAEKHKEVISKMGHLFAKLS